MAAAYLQSEQVLPRSFDETLREMYPAPDLPSRLTSFFLAANPAANPASIARKIRNWLSGKNQPASREDIFQISFALELSESHLDTCSASAPITASSTGTGARRSSRGFCAASGAIRRLVPF